MSVIDRDLVRWPRGKWIAAITIAFGIQVALLVAGSQKNEARRAVYPEEPQFAFAESTSVDTAGWMELENAFLFASANWHGFSGEAWLQKPRWTPPELGRAVPPRFLGFPDSQKFSPQPVAERDFTFGQRPRPAGLLPPPPETPGPEMKSRLRLEGFENRTLAGAISLPAQFHNDVLSSSVIQAMIGADGLVISARIIENSGSPKADADALALARKARFTPSRAGPRAPEMGKLIFDWFALDLGHTNNVKR